MRFQVDGILDDENPSPLLGTDQTIAEHVGLPSLISYSIDEESINDRPEMNTPDPVSCDFQARFYQGVSAWFNLLDSNFCDGSPGSAQCIVASHEETLDGAKLGRRQWIAHIAMVLNNKDPKGDPPTHM